MADLHGDGQDEIVAGFGTAGLWRYSNGSWTPLHTLGPGALASGRLH